MKQKRPNNRLEAPRRAGPMISAALAAAVLSGCAPVINPVTVVSLILDGVSYATTGKGPADHIISGVTDRDCAMYRTLFDEPVCDAHDEGVKTVENAETPGTFEEALQTSPVYMD
tara:strand:- start:897 stop:1241 length:345 start_codon:yes stop_codon:yes gene_type:complete